jgi:poly-gamma-glutamate capsule biosynthesis protein CapA/YwtB (metallophosphatase superfamily)
MKKQILFLWIVTFFVTIHAQQDETISTKESKDITIVAVGDIMMGTTFPNSSYLPPKGVDPFEDVRSVLVDGTVTFGNLEGTLTDTGKNAKRCKDPSKCYSFKTPESYGEFLKKAGFDVVSIANNHIGDFGQVGINNTLKTLDKHNIASAGILSKPTTVFERDGVKFGLIAFAPNKDCLKIHNLQKAEKLIKELKSKVDIVIVSFHGGAEGLKHKNITRKTEYFYGENRGNVYNFSHKVIDYGADIVLGHGPHILRGMEIYKNKLIAYSLGNFCTYKRFSLTAAKAYGAILQVSLDGDGNFIKGKIHSTLQTKPRYPFLDKEQKALKEIKRLTLEDFPENSIQFSDNGEISLISEK